MTRKLKYILTFLAGGVSGCTALAISLYFIYIHDGETIEKVNVPFKKEIAEYQLDELVQQIEFYKLVNGYYPKSLSELRDDYNDIKMYIDPVSLGSDCIHEYYYQSTDQNNSYTLRSPGDDEIIFTDDDIVPPVATRHIDKMGLLVYKQEDTDYTEVTCYEMDE